MSFDIETLICAKVDSAEEVGYEFPVSKGKTHPMIEEAVPGKNISSTLASRIPVLNLSKMRPPHKLSTSSCFGVIVNRSI